MGPPSARPRVDASLGSPSRPPGQGRAVAVRLRGAPAVPGTAILARHDLAARVAGADPGRPRRRRRAGPSDAAALLGHGRAGRRAVDRCPDRRRPLHLKAEHLQKTGSFKARGALARIAALAADGTRAASSPCRRATPRRRTRGPARRPASMSSSSCRRGAVRSKVEACLGYGAEVVLHGAHVGETFDAHGGAARRARARPSSTLRRRRRDRGRGLRRAGDPRGPARRGRRGRRDRRRRPDLGRRRPRSRSSARPCGSTASSRRLERHGLALAAGESCRSSPRRWPTAWARRSPASGPRDGPALRRRRDLLLDDATILGGPALRAGADQAGRGAGRGRGARRPAVRARAVPRRRPGLRRAVRRERRDRRGSGN